MDGSTSEVQPPSGPTQSRPTQGAESADRRWRSRPWVARSIRLTILAIPLVFAFLVALWLSNRWATPDGFWAQIGRFLAISAVSTVVLLILQRVARRFLPLAALYSLSLVFPDDAPSRFGLALRTKTPRQLEHTLEEVGAEGLGDTPSEAAEQLLELVAALSRHDRMTRGHSERVRAYSRMIGEEMGMDDAELDRLHWAGLVHDVGKMYVPAEILNKPGRLTDDEFEAIKRHTTEGQKLVVGLVPWLGGAANAVWEHHERWEGGGYPTGVPSSELAVESRIVCVADAFDVMTSARSYKKPLPAERARAELERCAGTQFDPNVVRAMMTISLGRLWAAMGPLSLVAQLRLFPRRLTQGGEAVAGAVAAALALLLTALAGSVADPTSAADDAAPTTTVAGAPSSEPATTEPVATDPPVTDPPATDPSVTEPAPVEPVATDPPPATPAPTTSTTTSTTTTIPPPTVSSTNPPPSTAAPAPAPPVTPRPTTPPSTAPPATAPPVTVPPVTVPPATVPPTTTTTTTLPDPTAPASLTLASSGPGDVESSEVLPLEQRPPINDGLANYDVDRDVDAGLTLRRSDAALDSRDRTEVQRWVVPAGTRDLAGPMRLLTWFAPTGGVDGGFMVVAAGLYDCDAGRTACTLLAEDVGVFPATTDRFNGVSFELSPAEGDHTIAAGRTVELRIAVPASSAADAIVAYDAAVFPAQLTFGA